MRFTNWGVDELIILDISTSDFHDLKRDDLFVSYNSNKSLDLVKKIAQVSFMPLTIGGRVRDLKYFGQLLSAGADKISINSIGLENPSFISDAAEKFGSQCVVASIDYKMNLNGTHSVYRNGGKIKTRWLLEDWCMEVEKRGVGEIILNSIDRDGLGYGFDNLTINKIVNAVKIPVIACGGAGKYSDFSSTFSETSVNALAAANIFHYFELSYPWCKKECVDRGIDVREIIIDSPQFQREPIYDEDQRNTKIDKRLEKAKNRGFLHKSDLKYAPITWCTECLYPSVNAAPMSFDDTGVCLGCRMSDQKKEVASEVWKGRKQKLAEILEESRCPNASRPDCIIAVSGGKDSYFQTHFIKNILGFNPILVTYYGNNYSEVGQRNLLRMKEVFGVDHIIYQPSVTLLKKLNYLGFVALGDMNWHNHIGICTTPMKIAVQLNIPIVIWGEHGYADLSGQFNLNDSIEWSYRNRLEHYCRGYEWNYFLNMMGISKSDMYSYQYPSDKEMFDLNLRGLHLNNYVKWEANEHTQLVIEKYGFEVPKYSFDRTYRNMSNLDDIHENGVHDYMKWIKFGYGRCTDHATKDIRAGIIDRKKGIELVKKYDHIKPSDLERWLKYVNMSEDNFDTIADTFRDPRVWKFVENSWVKDEIS